MIQSLKKLASHLHSKGFFEEALRVNAIVNRAEKRTKLFSDPNYQKNIQALLKNLGLSPNYNIEDAVELLSAAAYLKEGITDNNLLLSGLSIASLIPTMQDLKKVVGTSDIPADSALILPAAQLINKNQGLIKSSFDKFKDPKLSPYIKYYIPDGELLVQYSDRIWEALKNWALKAIKTPPPTEEASEIENTEDIEGQVDEMLSDLNSQL